MKDWRSLLLQYLLQQNISLAGEEMPVSEEREWKRRSSKLFLTDLTLIMWIDPLAVIFGLQ